MILCSIHLWLILLSIMPWNLIRIITIPFLIGFWHPTPVLLPGKSHGRRSLVGCRLWNRRLGHDWTTSLSLLTFMHWRRHWQPTPVFLPGESQGRGEPGGLLSMGSHRVGHDWSNLAAAAARVLFGYWVVWVLWSPIYNKLQWILII